MNTRRTTQLVLIFLIGTISCSRPSKKVTNVGIGSDGTRTRPASQRFDATVTRILDGDTIDIIDEKNNVHRIRLKGIDAPEKEQSFGARCTETLELLVSGKRVTIEWSKIDSRGRVIGKVSTDGLDICLRQVENGCAWHYKQFEKEQSDTDRRLYSKGEVNARLTRRGLWVDPTPVPPWDFETRVRSRQGVPSVRNLLDTEPLNESGGVIWGNIRTLIYHWPGCPYYSRISQRNRVTFHSREEAEKAGYRPARNCPTAR